jgi:hypothetical protein
MKLQLTSQGTNLVAFFERDVVDFDQFTSSQSVEVLSVGDRTEGNVLGLLIFQRGVPLFGVRVHSRMGAITPAVQLGPRLVVIAHDDHLLGIDLKSRERLVETDLGSPFREIIEIPGKVSLVCSDADIEAFDPDWNRVWRYSGDLIESCRLEGGDALVVHFMDRESERLSLATGKPAISPYRA